MENKFPKILHAAHFLNSEGRGRYLVLKQIDPHTFQWYQEQANTEMPTDVSAPTFVEAMNLAYRTWKDRSFRTLGCGFRYPLPERDEHGINALFHQMGASYNSSNGVYFDEELGHNCIVQLASLEARDLWNRLKDQKIS